jgi:hypothetical protein
VISASKSDTPDDDEHDSVDYMLSEKHVLDVSRDARAREHSASVDDREES